MEFSIEIENVSVGFYHQAIYMVDKRVSNPAIT